MPTRSGVDVSGAGDAAAIEPAIVVALEAARPWAGGERFALAGLDELELVRGDQRRLTVRAEGARRIGALAIPDPWLSGLHARIRGLRGGAGAAELEDAGSRHGTAVGGAAGARHALGDGAMIDAGRTRLVFQRGRPVGPAPHPGLATFEPALAAQVEPLARLAATALPLLIRGPTGSGKEVAAAAYHALAGRPGPFVAINLAAVAPALLESELFGHRRGAFTGAIEDRAGAIRSAHTGTLFLDEIAELSPAGQAALLRVLQEREVVPVGGGAPVAIDVRVIAATHEDLGARIAAGRFRQDLFARLAGHQLVLPPLAARRADLGALVARLLARIAGERAHALQLSRGALRLLFEHPWPMNIRELEHALTRAVALAGAGTIEAAHLAPVDEVAPAPAAAHPAAPAAAADPRGPDELLRLLAAHGGNVSAVARALDTSPSHVRRLLRRHGIDLDTARDPRRPR